jgi:hypothetical protein
MRQFGALFAVAALLWSPFGETLWRAEACLALTRCSLDSAAACTMRACSHAPKAEPKPAASCHAAATAENQCQLSATCHSTRELILPELRDAMLPLATLFELPLHSSDVTLTCFEEPSRSLAPLDPPPRIL